MQIVTRQDIPVFSQIGDRWFFYHFFSIVFYGEKAVLFSFQACDADDKADGTGIRNMAVCIRHYIPEDKHNFLPVNPYFRIYLVVFVVI